MNAHSLPSRSIALAALLLIAGAALAWWKPWSKDTLSSSLLYGNIDIREVQLAFRVGGRLESMAVEEGDIVTKGMPLAKLDEQPLREALAVLEANAARAQAELDRVKSGARPQEISQAKAHVREAESAFTNAEKELARQDSLLKSRNTSQTATDRAEAKRDQTSAQLASAREALTLLEEGARVEDIAAAAASQLAARAQLVQGQTQVSDATLLAPNQGIITTRAREPGSLLTVGQPVYALALTDKVFVRAYVEEPNLGSVAPGTGVTITSDSTSKRYNGQVGFVSPRAEFTPRTVETPELRTDLVYRLRILVLDADDKLRQGMPVTVHLPSTPASSSS